MIYNFRGIDYEVEFEDLPKKADMNQRHFQLRDENGKGWSFTVKYIMNNNFPDCKFNEPHTSGFPKIEQAAILEKSLGL